MYLNSVSMKSGVAQFLFVNRRLEVQFLSPAPYNQLFMRARDVLHHAMPF